MTKWYSVIFRLKVKDLIWSENVINKIEKREYAINFKYYIIKSVVDQLHKFVAQIKEIVLLILLIYIIILNGIMSFLQF